MYTPASFAVDDLPTLHEFMRRHSFATVVSTDNSAPLASHLPLLIDPEPGKFGRLTGHMARANSQWKSAGNQRVMVIFHGPHAYITPSWYTSDNVVPTWNYAAVHAYGVLKTETNATKLRQIVDQYVDTYEAELPQPWSLNTPDPEFVDQMVSAIVGFTIDIDRIEGKWKLSQNHSEERRQRVIAGLLKRLHPGDAEVAAMMNGPADC